MRIGVTVRDDADYERAAFLCLLPGSPFPPLLSNSLGIPLSLLFLGNPIAQSNLLKVAFFVPLLGKPTALNALTTAEFLYKAFADVTVDAQGHP